MKVVLKTINIILSIGLIVIALGIAYIAIPYFGNQALIVRSGSMSPSIGVGSIVVIRPSNNSLSPITDMPKYQNGDVVAFRSENNSETIITHRIVGSTTRNDKVIYKTKGDANKTVDGWEVQGENILGKAYLTIPWAGVILTFAKSKLGLPLLIILPALLVVILEIIAITKEVRKNLKRSRKNPATASSNLKVHNFNILKVLIPLLIIAGIAIPVTFAFQKDTEQSTDNLFAAAESFSTSPTPSPTPAETPTLTPTSTPSPTDTSLFFSEYVEGSSNNKALEIYNPTGESVDISDYVINIYHNGNTSPGIITLPSVSLASGDVYVVCHASAGSEIQAVCDNQTGSLDVNGDDTIELQDNSNATLDVIGQIGFDPGTEWGSGLTSTQDNTLTRKCSVTQGDPIGSDVFDPSLEWDGYETDTFTYLGSYNCL